MDDPPVSHTASLWRWIATGKASWFFLTIDGPAAEALSATALMRRLELGQARGFGSLKVEATIGNSSWRTSVFPKKGSAAWDLPVKAAIRRAEGLTEGDKVTVHLRSL